MAASRHPRTRTSPASGRVAAVFLLAAIAGLVTAGCAGSHSAATPAEPAESLVWPAPPETARISYVQSVYRPRDLEIKASAFTRFGRWLTGSEKGNEPLVKPFSVALDENDNLCLTDTGANTVSYYDRQAKKWSRWDRAGNTRFESPVAVAKTGGTIFVADAEKRAVLAMDAAGQLRFAITNRLGRPAGLAVVKAELFVADVERHAIVVFDLGGAYRREFGRRGTGPGEFNFPTHVAADPAGGILVTDSMNSRLQLLDVEGRCLAQIGGIGDSPGQFSRPKGAALDSLGHIYALDAMFDNVQIFDRQGKFLLNLGVSGSKPGEFWLPNGIAIDKNNEIFIADCYNHRVQILKYIGPS